MTRQQDAQIRWSLSGRADRYVTAEGEKRPLKDEPLPFALLMLASVAGTVLMVTQVHGHWWLQILGTVVAFVAMVATAPYKWRTVYWDLLMLAAAAVSFVTHVKLSLGG